MLIALFGPPGAGKDTVAMRLVDQHGFLRVAFADKVRELAYEVATDTQREQINYFGWEKCKRQSEDYRKLLERVGDGARKVLGESLWIDAVYNEIDALLDDGKSVVITDLRKENEAEMVKDFNGIIWYVTRPGCEKRPFDEWKPEWAAFTVYNNDTIEVLNQRVDEVLELCQ
jgi:dephospho-CoA kinase